MTASFSTYISKITNLLYRQCLQYAKRYSKQLFATLFVLSIPFTAMAVPVDPSLAITGSVQFDTVNSVSATGGANQNGAFSGTFNGVNTSSTINNTTVTGTNPVNGNMTEIGDSLSSVMNFAGSSGGTNGGMFTDFLLIYRTLLQPINS